MLAAYCSQPVTQEDVARWLNTTGIGTPASNIRRLEQHGFGIFFGTGSWEDVSSSVDRGVPCILFVRTGDLGYWRFDTPHAVILTGTDSSTLARVSDPAVGDGSTPVPVDELLLAWSHFDYAYATIQAR
jgi:hypothetical protein